MAKIVAVCSSKKKGTRKETIAEGILKEDYGLIGDAHADCGIRRQISLLAMESISKMRESGFDVGPGDFAENITSEGINLVALPIGTQIHTGRGRFHGTGKTAAGTGNDGKIRAGHAAVGIACQKRPGLDRGAADQRKGARIKRGARGRIAAV